MLYTDSDVLNASDLSAIDPEVSAVAAAEQIIIDGDGGIIREAWNECADEILGVMQSFGGDLWAWPGQITALNFLGTSRPRVRLQQIVVSSNYTGRKSPLVRWMLYRTLVLFYRSASNRRERDRYDKKRDQFDVDAKRAWRSLFIYGLPIVGQPLSAPGSTHEPSAGAWSSANLSTVAGGTQPGSVSYDVAITWTASQYQSATLTQNAESGPSATQTITVAAGQVVRISIASLNPPGTIPDQSGTADGIVAPLTASGWNVYAGPSGGVLTLQNGSPVAVATKTYTLADAPTTTGAALGAGQSPNANYTMQRILNRG